MRLAILIGAGASYGCGYTDPSARPPLGHQLFDQLVDKYAETWGALLDPDLPDLFRRNFEEGMAETWRRQPDRFSHLLIDMATFFSRFDPPGENDLYSALVGELARSRLIRRTGVASLNYECVFEIAVSRLGLRLCMNLDRPAPGQVLMWKPHGSCNFLPQASVWQLTVQLTSTDQSYYDGPITIKQTAEVRKMYDAEYALPPCMSLYAEGKATLVGQSFIEETRRSWTDWARRCDYIITVGAHPNLADAHVWEPVLDSKAIVWFVGGEDEHAAELADQLGNRFRHVGQTFAEAAPTLIRRLRILA